MAVALVAALGLLHTADGRVYPGYESRGRYASLLVVEASSGKVLLEDDADLQRAPASVTKLMTALLLVEAVEAGTVALTDTVHVSWDASKIGGSRTGLYSHEQLSVRDLGRALMIASGNDAAAAVANHLARSRSIFALRMNRRARELGMHQTRYVSSHGLEGWAETSLTTARDQARLAREVLRHPLILQWSSTRSATIRGGQTIRNTNKLLGRFEGMDGLKTGFTGKAGFCLVATAEREGMRLISVVLGSPNSDARFAETEAALEWAFVEYERRHVLHAGQIVGRPLATGGEPDSTALRAASDAWIVARVGDPRRIRYELELPSWRLPLESGQAVGMVQLRLGDSLIHRIPVVISEDVEPLPWWKRLARSLRGG